MREHAIPQDVTGYRFHIIGNMTLKQFVEVAVGCVIGLIIYSTNLPMIIKWPLITLFVAMGAMAAFVPIEERPFDHWIMTFFKVLYKPTKFFWRRDSKLPDPFLYNPLAEANPLEIEIDLKPARRQRIKEYLTSVQVTSGTQYYDEGEQTKMNGILAMFDTVDTVTPLDVVEQTKRPDLKVRVRAFRPQQLDVVEHVPSDPPMVAATVIEEPALIQAADDLTTQLPITQVGQDISIPELPSVAIDSQMNVSSVNSDAATLPTDMDRSFSTAQFATPNTAFTQEVIQNNDLPFPAPPSEPNKIVGMVLSATNELLNDTIVQITAESGQIVRAVKTNALGQFFITTPLENGTYTIDAEKEGFTFPLLQLSLTGQLVAPLEIRSAA